MEGTKFNKNQVKIRRRLYKRVAKTGSVYRTRKERVVFQELLESQRVSFESLEVQNS